MSPIPKQGDILRALVCLILAIPLQGDANCQEPQVDRLGLAYGVHLGLGTGQIEDGNEDQPRRFGMSAGIWGGYGVSQQWVLRADLRIWRRMTQSQTFSIAEPIIGVAFFPNGESLFLHGGFGAGYVTLDPWDVGTTPVGAWGPDIFLGVGYEFQVSPTTVFSVHMDANYTHLGELSRSNIKLSKVGVNYTDIVFTYSWY